MLPRILSSASNLCSHWRRFPRDCASCRIGPQYALEAERARAARAICHDVLWAKVIKARQVATAHGALQFLTLRHKICVWEDCDQFRPKLSVKGQDLSPGLERPANDFGRQRAISRCRQVRCECSTQLESIIPSWLARRSSCQNQLCHETSLDRIDKLLRCLSQSERLLTAAEVT